MIDQTVTPDPDKTAQDPDNDNNWVTLICLDSVQTSKTPQKPDLDRLQLTPLTILFDSDSRSEELDNDKLRRLEVLYDRKEKVAPETDIPRDNDSQAPDIDEQGLLTTSPSVFDNLRPDSDNIRQRAFANTVTKIHY